MRPGQGAHGVYAQAERSRGWRWSIAALFFALSGCVPHVIWVGRDPARNVRAEVLSLGDKQWLRTGEAQGERFDGIATDELVFASDGAAVAYPALRDGKWFVVSSRKTFGPFDSVSETRFSPDGSRLGFVAQTSAGFHAVIDGVPSRPFEHLQPDTLQFSRNSAHFTFVGSSKACATIVVDGVEAPCRERVHSLRVSNAGTTAAVIREQGKDRFLLGEELGPPVEQISEWILSESGRTAYAARTGSLTALFLDGVSTSECGQVRNLRFGNNDQRFAFVCVDQGGSVVVVDGTPGPVFPVVGVPVLASQAPDFAYIARDLNSTWVLSGDSRLGPYSAAGELVVAPSGRGLAFLARASGQHRIVHRSSETTVDAFIEGTLVLSDDGDHWAAITGVSATQHLWLTVDGKHLRRVIASEIFGAHNPEFRPWISRELRLAHGASR